MGNENPTGICKPQILRNTSYIVTSEEVFVEGVVMIIFPKEIKFLYDHHRKGDEPWRKIPTGICKARRHYIDSIADIHIQGCSGHQVRIRISSEIFSDISLCEKARSSVDLLGE